MSKLQRAIRNTLLVAALSALGTLAPAQPRRELTGSELDLQKTPTAADAQRLGLPVAALPQLIALRDRAATEHGRAVEQSSAAGIQLGTDASGTPTLIPDVTPTPRTLVIAPSVKQLLTRDPKIDLASLLDQLNGSYRGAGGDNTKSVPPTWITPPDHLPLKERAEALLNGWSDPAPVKSTCVAGQKEFNEVVEPVLAAGNDIYLTRSLDNRQRWIKAVNDFDQGCLETITPSTANHLPLNRIAILSTEAGGAFCMALHLGGDRFVTARHCFYDPMTGARASQRVRANLNMVDRSDPKAIPIEEDATQPYPPMAKIWQSGRDLLVLRAPQLASGVRSRTVSSDELTFSNTTAEPALLLGYFPLAIPERRLPPQEGERGDPPAWSDALRITKQVGPGYCRVWSRSSLEGLPACLEHSCQSVPGFSGAPVFVRRGDRWLVVGINVAGAVEKTAKSCGQFASNGSRGLLNSVGGIAAIIPKTLASAQNVSSIHSEGSGSDKVQ